MLRRQIDCKRDFAECGGNRILSVRSRGARITHEGVS